MTLPEFGYIFMPNRGKSSATGLAPSRPSLRLFEPGKIGHQLFGAHLVKGDFQQGIVGHWRGGKNHPRAEGLVRHLVPRPVGPRRGGLYRVGLVQGLGLGGWGGGACGERLASGPRLGP